MDEIVAYMKHQFDRRRFVVPEQYKLYKLLCNGGLVRLFKNWRCVFVKMSQHAILHPFAFSLDEALCTRW